MKARVKATGEIIEVKVYKREHRLYVRIEGEKTGEIYRAKDLDFNIEDGNTSDYWTRLEHTYAGMAMQGMLTDEWGSTYISNPKSKEQHLALVTNAATEIAHALVEKLKEKEE